MEDEDVFFVKKGLISAAFCPLSCRFFFVKEVDGDPDKHLHQHIPLGYFGSTPPTQQSPGWHYIFRLDRIPIWTFICDDCILGGGGYSSFWILVCESIFENLDQNRTPPILLYISPLPIASRTRGTPVTSTPSFNALYIHPYSIRTLALRPTFLHEVSLVFWMLLILVSFQCLN